MPTVKSYQKQKEKEKIAYDYFINQGYSPEASAGIVGNLVYESGLNTTAEGDIGFSGGSSYGIAQFRGKRLQDLKKRYGNNWTDFGNQLDFVRHELETTHQRANVRLKSAKNAYEAGSAFSDLYEIPAKKYKDNIERQKKVNRIYSAFGGTSPTPIMDKEISQTNTYFENLPTTTVKDFEYTPDNSNLAEEIEEKPKDKDIEEVKQQTNEYNFLKDYQNIVNQPTQPQVVQQEQPVQEYVSPNLTDIYAQVSNFIDQPVAQQGGEYYDLPMNTPNPIAPRQFMIDYIKSPKYRERLIKSNYDNVDEEIKIRLSQANPVVYPYKEVKTNWWKSPREVERGSHYNAMTGKIMLDPTYDIGINNDLYLYSPKPTIQEIETHERSHATVSDFPSDRLNITDYRKLKNYHKKNINVPEHDLIPGENKADLDAFRYMLKRDGIYDAGKQEFTPEMFKKAKKSATKDRLRSVYSDKDIIYLMNNIAQNEEESDLNYGQQGGTADASQEFLQMWYPNRVLPDSKLNEDYQKEKNLYVEKSLNLPAPTYVDDIDGSTQGEYDFKTNSLKVLNTASPYTKTHEWSHFINIPLKDTQSNNNAFEIIGENIIPQENIQNTWVKENYPEISNYQEIIPRLNSYRQLHNLKPDQVITPELIQQNREKYNTGTIPYEDNTDQLYKLFEDQGLSNVLNKVVSNERNNTYYAQSGGMPISSNGVYDYPGENVIVPTKDGKITMKSVNYPILGIDEFGNQKLMQPNGEYQFEGKTITEIPQLTEAEKEFLKEISQQYGQK